MTTATLAFHPFAMTKPVNAGPRPTAKRRDEKVTRLATQCSACNLRELCLPCGLKDQDMGLFADVVYTRRRVKRGEHLYRAGEAFDSIYALRSGFFK
jgi:CRP/FNR family transcriptional regulator